MINPTPEQILEMAKTGKFNDGHLLEKAFLTAHLNHNSMYKDLKLDMLGLFVLLNDEIITKDDYQRILTEINNHIY